MVRAWLFAMLALVTTTHALSQAWPSRPLRFVVPFPAGSSPDVTARIISSKLSANLGQSIVIENRSGAAGIIAADLVAKAQPDGYTFLYPVNSVICANPHLYSKLPYDGLNSFVPVTMTVRFGYVLLANPKFPVNDMAGLISAAKAQPGKFNFGSAGNAVGCDRNKNGAHTASRQCYVIGVWRIRFVHGSVHYSHTSGGKWPWQAIGRDASPKTFRLA